MEIMQCFVQLQVGHGLLCLHINILHNPYSHSGHVRPERHRPSSKLQLALSRTCQIFAAIILQDNVLHQITTWDSLTVRVRPFANSIPAPTHVKSICHKISAIYPKWSVCKVCAAQQVLINMLLQSAIRYTAWCWQWSRLRWKSGKWFLFQGRWSDDFVQREVSARIIRIDVVASRCWFHSGQLLFSLLAVRQCNFKWKSIVPQAVLCHISVIWALRSSAE